MLHIIWPQPPDILKLQRIPDYGYIQLCILYAAHIYIARRKGTSQQTEQTNR